MDHAVAKELIESTLSHDLDPTPKEFFQLSHEAAGKPRARILSNLNEKVYIALRSGIAPRHRPEHADARDAMPPGKSENLLPF